jgi:hypothetical protein
MLSSNLTYGLVIANIGGLLSIVVIVSIIAEIYGWYYDKFILPKIEEDIIKNQTNEEDRVRYKLLMELGLIEVTENIQNSKVDTSFKWIIDKQTSLYDESLKENEKLKQLRIE